MVRICSPLPNPIVGASLVGARWGWARHPGSPIVLPPQPRPAGLRSGTHGGDPAANTLDICSCHPTGARGHPPSCRTPIRYPRWGTGGGYAGHMQPPSARRTRPSPVLPATSSSYRTPIRYPRWGAGGEYAGHVQLPSDSQPLTFITTCGLLKAIVIRTGIKPLD